MPVPFSAFEQFFCALAMVLTIAAFLPYLLGTVTGRISPHRATWLIWAVLATMSASAQLAAGSGPTVWFAATQAGGTLLVAALALRTGWGRLTNATEMLVIACAAFGLLLWKLTSEPAYALAISISISACAAVPTVLKSYYAPVTEDKTAWTLKFVASISAVIGASQAGPVMLAYPVYLTILYGAMLTALALGKRRDRATVMMAAE